MPLVTPLRTSLYRHQADLWFRIACFQTRCRWPSSRCSSWWCICELPRLSCCLAAAALLACLLLRVATRTLMSSTAWRALLSGLPRSVRWPSSCKLTPLHFLSDPFCLFLLSSSRPRRHPQAPAPPLFAKPRNEPHLQLDSSTTSLERLYV